MNFQASDTVRNLFSDIDSLYRREMRLLQDGRYEEWLGFFTDDVRYHVPVVMVRENREEMVARDDELAYYDETLQTLTLRVKKLSHEMAWTEVPPSRTRYFLQIMDVEPGDEEEVFVTSNLLIYQTRHDNEENFFFGERLDRMRLVEGAWKVAHRRVVLDRSRLGAENISVFF